MNEIIINDNGRFFKGRVTDSQFNRIVSSLMTSPANLAFNTFKRLLAEQDAATIPNYNTEECNGRFPPSNKAIDQDKVITITVGLIGCTEEDIKEISIVDDIITLRIDSKKNAERQKKFDVLYGQRGLKLPVKEVVMWRFNPLFHDGNTLEYKLEDSILTMTIQPRESLKPIKKAFKGSIEEDDALLPETDEPQQEAAEYAEEE